MYSVSQQYLTKAETQLYTPRVSVAGTVIDPEAVESMDFTMGAWDGGEAVSLGLAMSSGVELQLRKELVDITAFSGKLITIHLGQLIQGVTEYAPMGAYYCVSAQDDEGIITVRASDAVGYKMDGEYEELDGVDFDAGVSAKAFATAMASHLGVTADLSLCPDVTLTQEPQGYTWRQCWAMLAALGGCFVYADRYGVVCFGWYGDAGVTITEDMYYADGLQKGENDFTIQWIKCYTDGEEILTCGDETGAQGMEFECLWMTQELLETVWEKVGGFTYRAIPSLRMLGDVRPDVWDMASLVTSEGETVVLPVVGLRQEFDGGLSTTITAPGTAMSTGFRGNVARQSTNTRRQMRAIVQTVTDVEGRMSQVEQLAGQVKLTITTELGVLETRICGAVEDEENPQEAAWEAKFTDPTGNVQSGFYFDFENGQFRFDGSGQFWSPDKNSYIQLDGQDMVLYRKNSAGNFMQAMRLGASEMTDGSSDNSYILFGVGSVSDGLGIVKRFDNGIWVGDSYAAVLTGTFSPTIACTGLFVDTWEGKVYAVNQGVKTQIYAGIYTARFA